VRTASTGTVNFMGLATVLHSPFEVDLLTALGYSNLWRCQNRQQLLLFLSYINFHTSLQ
jgi:hypothetical protein